VHFNDFTNELASAIPSARKTRLPTFTTEHIPLQQTKLDYVSVRPSPKAECKNPFLIIRFIFFSLLVYLNIVILIFASWNVHAARSSNVSVPAVVIFIIYNCCMVFLLVPVALIELIRPNIKVARVNFECVWTAILSIFQIGATFSVTISGPLSMCRLSSGTSELCASSSLLVLTVWFGTMTVFGYFLVLFVTAVTHASTFPTVWSTTVYAVPWFGDDSDCISTKAPSGEGSSDKGESQSRPQSDVESRHTIEQEVPAPRPSIRRGVDEPFRRKATAPSSRNPFAGITVLYSPPDARKKGETLGRPDGSRYVEVFRDSRLPVTPGGTDTSYYCGVPLEGVPRVNAFPTDVDDNDQPIPLPHLSEWFRADAALGNNIQSRSDM